MPKLEYRPNTQLDVRGKLTVHAKPLFEIADLSYIQAADLMTMDDNSGLMNK